MVSRVNNPDNMRHWVVRHSESLGLNANDVWLCKDRGEKGPIAKRLLVTHAIDDNSACVYVMARDAWTTLEVPLLFSSGPYEKQGCYDSWLKERLLVTDNFREVALHEKFGLEASEKVWNFLCENGPPHRPHEPETLEAAWKMLREEYQSPTSPSESENDRAAAPAAGHAPKVWRPKLDQAAETPQQQESKPSEKATGSEKKPSDKPQDTAVSREGAADLKAKVELQDDQERPKVTLTARKKGPEAEATAAGEGGSRSRKVTQEQPSGSQPPAELQMQKKKQEGTLDEDETYESSYEYYSSDDDEEQAAAAPEQPPPTIPEPKREDTPEAKAPKTTLEPQGKAPPVWQGRTPDSQWTRRKQERADNHKAAASAGPPKKTKITEVPMCKRCGKNQPGAYCPHKLCRRCCTEPCPQHH